MKSSLTGCSNKNADSPAQVQIQLPLSPDVLAETGTCQIHKRTNQTYEDQQHMHLLSEFPCKQYRNLFYANHAFTQQGIIIAVDFAIFYPTFSL
jgi:hypothetical protein